MVADVPVLTGVSFSAVAEVHASAVEIDDDILIVLASEQCAVCSSTDPGRAPRVGSVPTSGAFGSEPLEHMVQRVDLDGRPTEGVVVLEPLEHSVLDVSLDGRPMAGKLDLEPLEHSVSEEDQTGGSMEGEFTVVMCTHFRSYLRGLSLPSVQTIAPSSGSKDSRMKTACWPAGICYWDNSRLHSSTIQGLSMRTRM